MIRHIKRSVVMVVGLTLAYHAGDVGSIRISVLTSECTLNGRSNSDAKHREETFIT